MVNGDGDVDIQEEQNAAGEESAAMEEDEEEDGLFCICLGQDDHTPMIQCEGCENWFHFSCIQLDPAEAQVIEAFYCDLCEESGTGLTKKIEIPAPPPPPPTKKKTTRSTRPEPEEPESEEAPEEEEEDDDHDDSAADPDASGAESDSNSSSSRDDADEAEITQTRSRRTKTASGAPVYRGVAKPAAGRKKMRKAEGMSDEGSGSDDDFVGDGEVKVKATLTGKKRKASTHIDSRPATHPRQSGSTSSAGPSAPSSLPPPPSTSTATIEKTRKACVAQFVMLLNPAFSTSASSTEPVTEPITEPVAEPILKRNAQEYAEGIEKELFEVFGEVDHSGTRVPRSMYLSKFRTLLFNLKNNSKILSDLSTSDIAPNSLVHMSNEDLQTPQQRAEAEHVRQQSLKDSVKTVTEAPRAKRPHKGEEEIEAFDTIDSEAAVRVEAAREAHAEAVMQAKEAEVRARDAQFGRQRSDSISTAPPPTPHGAPLPLVTPARRRSSSGLLNSAPNTALLRPEDLGLDEDGPPSPRTDQEDADKQSMPPPRRPSVNFDLESVWTSMRPVQSPVTATAPSFPDPIHASPTPVEKAEDDMDLEATPEGTPEYEPELEEDEADPEDGKDEGGLPDDYDPFASMDVNSDNGNDDLDRILHDGNTVEAPVVVATDMVPLQASPLESLPPVWTGNVMTVDEGGFAAVARQVGGRPVGTDPSVWQQLFPTETINVVGRLPVKNSIEYLVQSHFAATRELIVVDLAPNGEGPPNLPPLERVKQHQQRLINFFSEKERHAVVATSDRTKRVVKDIYLVPLRQYDPIPEFIELLDDHGVPDVGSRTDDTMLAVFVLQKGILPTVMPSMPLPAPPIAMTTAPILPPIMPAQPPLGAPLPTDPTALDVATVRALLSNPHAFRPVLESTPGMAQSLAMNPNLMAAFQSDPSLVQQLALYPTLLNALLSVASQAGAPQPAPGPPPLFVPYVQPQASPRRTAFNSPQHRDRDEGRPYEQRRDDWRDDRHDRRHSGQWDDRRGSETRWQDRSGGGERLPADNGWGARGRQESNEYSPGQSDDQYSAPVFGGSNQGGRRRTEWGGGRH